MTAARVTEPEAPSVLRRCIAPAAFLLVGVWGVTWMLDPAHVPGDIDQVHAALQRLHPTDEQAAAGYADLPPLTPAERSVQVADKIGSEADAAIAASALALLFGVLAGSSPRPWLFRLHRWSRFVALCLTVPMVLAALAELSPGVVIAALDLLPASLVAGLICAILLWRRSAAATIPVKLGRRRSLRP